MGGINRIKGHVEVDRNKIGRSRVSVLDPSMVAVWAYPSNAPPEKPSESFSLLQACVTLNPKY